MSNQFNKIPELGFGVRRGPEFSIERLLAAIRVRTSEVQVTTQIAQLCKTVLHKLRDSQILKLQTSNVLIEDRSLSEHF